MGLKACRALLCLAALMSGGTVFAQWTVDPPGARQPVAPAKPRIAPVLEAQWNDAQRQLVARHVIGGRPDNGGRTLLNLPELADAVMPYTNYLTNGSSIVGRQRELLVMRAAWLAGNQLLWAAHAPLARNAGISPEEFRRIAQGPDTSGWDPFEATLLRLADQLYKNSSVTNATWQALSARY